jgi:hypothetical protein
MQQVGRHMRPAEMVQHQVDTASRVCIEHGLHERFGQRFRIGRPARVDGGPCAELEREAPLVGRARPGDHLDAEQAAQLDQRAAHAAGRTVEVHAAGQLAARGVMQQAPGQLIVRQRDGLRGVDALRQRDQRVGRHHHLLRVAAAARVELACADEHRPR